MHQIKVNDKFNFAIGDGTTGLIINGSVTPLNVEQISEASWHIINDLKSYNAEVISFDALQKKALIKINNNTYTISAKNEFDILLDQLGLGNLNAPNISEVKAPMPGLVLKVFVTEGMAVKKGENLFVLEAMKMENIIKSTADVVVKSVKIKPGDKVEKNQVLMVF